MKIKGKIKCPNCGSKITHLWKVEHANIWDEGTHETMINAFGEGSRVSGSTDNVIYNCRCETCQSYFTTMVLMKVEVENIVTSMDLYDVESIKKRDLENRIQKDEEE